MRWSRIEYPVAPQGHALIARLGDTTWRTYQLSDTRWLLEPVSSSGRAITVGSLAEARELVKSYSRRKTRRRNGAGTGAFIGSLVGSMAGMGVGSLPLAGLASIVGGGIGGAIGAQPDRRKRGAGGGAIGGALLGPIGAGIGGYIGGQRPDYDFQRHANLKMTNSEKRAKLLAKRLSR